MPKPIDILKQFSKLQKQAEKHVSKARKAVEKKIAKEVAAVHKKYAKELKQLEGFLGGAIKAPKVLKSTSSGKRTRRNLPKRTDEEIKAAITKVSSGGKKVTSNEIFSAAQITRPRFNEFLKANKGFLKVEGNKRSTKYFL